MSKRRISARLGISATAAGESIRRARRGAGVCWPLPKGLAEDALEHRLYRPTDRAIIDKQRRGHTFAVPPVIKQHKRIRPPCEAIRNRPVTRQFDWSGTILRR